MTSQEIRDEQLVIMKKREIHQIDIRKNCRKNEFNKIRKLNSSIISADICQDLSCSQSDQQTEIDQLKMQYCQIAEIQYQSSEIQFLLDQLKKSKQQVDILHSVVGLRKLISCDDDQMNSSNLQIILDYDGLDLILRTLQQQQDNEIILIELIWIIANIASGNHDIVQSLVEKGGIKLIVNLIKQKSYISIKEFEQIVWALANIAGDNYQFRDIIIDMNILDKLILNSKRVNSEEIYGNFIWFLGNITRGNPSPDLNKLAIVLPIFIEAIKQYSDQNILSEALWSIDVMVDFSQQYIDTAFQLNMIDPVICHLQSSYPSIQHPAIRIIGSMLAGEEDIVEDQMIEKKVHIFLFDMLKNQQKTRIVKDILWVISNLSAGSKSQCMRIFENISYIDQIYQFLCEDFRQNIKKEALYIISNTIEQKVDILIERIIKLGYLQILSEILNSEDQEQKKIALESYLNLLDFYYKRNGLLDFKAQADQYNISKKIEDLQFFSNDKIYMLCFEILTKFYECDDFQDEFQLLN